MSDNVTKKKNSLAPITPNCSVEKLIQFMVGIFLKKKIRSLLLHFSSSLPCQNILLVVEWFGSFPVGEFEIN